MKFKIGDRVKLKKGSRFDDGTMYNPINVEGTINRILEEYLSHRVMWDNGFSNIYSSGDLDLIKEVSALDLIKNSKGQFVTVKFTKKDGSVRVLNGKYLSHDKKYIQMKESIKLIKGENPIRNVSIDNILEVRVGGKTYNFQKEKEFEFLAFQDFRGYYRTTVTITAKSLEEAKSKIKAMSQEEIEENCNDWEMADDTIAVGDIDVDSESGYEI